MPTGRMDLERIPFVGAFSLTTDRVALFPRGKPRYKREAVGVLEVPVVEVDVSGSPLIGVMLAGNSRGIVCSELFEVGGTRELRKLGIEVGYVPGRFTALGNMILVNDRGAVVSPELPEGALRVVSEILGVRIERGTVAGFKNVGAAAVATNRGVLLHPGVREEEVKLVEKTLGVPADVGTACGGVELVGLCAVANSKGILAGSLTTGPELGRMESALGFL